MRYQTLALAIFFSAPIHASQKCDADADSFLIYYSTTLPEKLMSATPEKLTEKVAEERMKAKEQQIYFYDTCLWPQMVKGEEPNAPYREIDRLFVNIDSYLSIFRTTKNRKEDEYIINRYCVFTSKGVTKFPECKAISEL